jgi:nicotinamidase/pyrazinamidase
MRALIVVDVQNDFVSGSLPVPDAQEVAERIQVLMQVGNYDYVVATQDWHVDPGDHFDKWPVHCKAGEHGAEIAKPLDVWKFDAMFRKGQHSDGYSGFEGITSSGEMLEQWLSNHHVDQVDIVGLALDHCVRATALDAARLNFDTRVLARYTAAVEDEKVWGALRELEDAQVKLAFSKEVNK